jgi:hypothetical protein
MQNPIMRWSALWLTLAIITLAGCNQPAEEEVGQTQEGDLVLGPAEVTHTVERAVSLNTRPLVLDGFNGTVRLDGADADVAQLTFIKRARGQDDAAARNVLGGIQLIERGDASQYEYVMQSDQPNRSEVDVRGTVPHETTLQIGFESGAVALSGVTGPIDVEHRSGNVQIAGAGASVRVDIQNGSIQLGLEQLPADAQVSLLTSNGDLTLAVPETVSAQLTAQTQAGPINVQDVSFTSRRLDPQGAGARFEAQLGAGNATIELRTENGAITLRSRQAEPLVPADSMAVEPEDTTQAMPPDTAAPDTAAPDTGQVILDAPADTTAAEAP